MFEFFCFFDYSIDMNLHRTEKKPQWESTPEAERNVWQRIAQATKGMVTPANAISLLGLGLTASGLQDFKRGARQQAVAKIILGRACDIADGYVADKTKTKSPIGEAVDATVDKISMAHGLYVLRETDTLPVFTTASFFTQNVINTAATAVAKKRGVELHPSAEGKITTLMQWAAIGGYIISAVRSQSEGPSAIEGVSNLLSAGATVLGSVVNIQYIKQATAHSSGNNNIGI
jgi:phosphatidylglycerophosphate synthase